MIGNRWTLAAVFGQNTRVETDWPSARLQEGFPKMSDWYERVKSLEGVASYLSTRVQPKDRCEALKGL